MRSELLLPDEAAAIADVVAVPRIESVVVQATPFCNINCSYCYLPQRNVKTVMEQATVAALFEKIFASGWANAQLTVIWHAGEPLVLPISFYQTAFETIEAMRPAHIELRHAIQTNGMLITPEWCDFFRKWHVGVGVSIDGPQRLHDAHRVTRSGRGTFEQTVAGIRLLRREDVPFHVISVLSKDSMDAPDEMLDFYLAEGIEDVCFNVEESEGDHVSGLFRAGDPQRRFRAFLDRFWTLSRQSPGIRFIREIDDMIPRIFRPDGTQMGNSQVEPFGMLNVDCHGNVSSFSPELLGYKHADYNNFIIGNVNRDSLERHAAERRDDGDDPRHRSGRGRVPAGMRIFFGVRRRFAGEQALGERKLSHRPHVVLQPGADGADGSHSRCAGPTRAKHRRRQAPAILAVRACRVHKQCDAGFVQGRERQ